MVRSTLKKLAHPDNRALALTVGGMAALTVGAPRLPALGMFAMGARRLEEGWRQRHPRFQGGARERWKAAETFYEGTHQDPTNRVLHVVGIPMIVGGAVGMIAFRPLGLTAPLWFGSAGSFAAGWALNIVGHAVFEKNAPAFRDDPLSFVAGPVWDARHVVKRLGRQSQASA
ncbi:MAG: DUF962 domain-containing protein [Alphaproteobacteria bacterium]|nr:DUF962 domain-containing protein [Alphaproteobacteria bacterium]